MAIGIFISVVYVISAFGYYLWFEYSELAAFIPILAPVAGYLTVFAFMDKSERIPFRIFSRKEASISFLLPLGYILPAMIVSVIISGGTINLHNLTIPFILEQCIRWFFAGICEEIGWRGFLLPALSKNMSRMHARVICGLIWGIWHIPMIVNGLAVTQYTRWISIMVFIVETIAITIIMDFIPGSSIWRFVCFHAAHNIFVQIGVKILSENCGELMNDGGVVLVIFIIITTMTFIFRERKAESSK